MLAETSLPYIVPIVTVPPALAVAFAFRLSPYIIEDTAVDPDIDAAIEAMATSPVIFVAVVVIACSGATDAMKYIA
jgi:hypothetical protein